MPTPIARPGEDESDATTIRTTAEARKVFVVLNPASGTCTAEDVRRALDRHFNAERGECRVHETSPEDDIAQVVREAASSGCALVVAAGGDGTVSAVANGLVGSKTPMGILPLGTANVLARELGIPIDLEAACGLVAGRHRVASIDAMRVDGQGYFTQVGVGIDALMIRDTSREDKRRFGKVAYLWTAGKQLVGFQPRRFRVEADGKEVRARASQVVIANCGMLGQPPFRWGPGIVPDDGRLDVCIVRARTILDYLSLAWYVVLRRHRSSSNVKYLTARERVRVETARPFPVQADGEIIGETPVQVDALAGAVRVVVPETDDARPSPD